MAIRLTASSSQYLYTTKWMPKAVSANFSMCGWVYATTWVTTAWNSVFGYDPNEITAEIGFNQGPGGNYTDIATYASNTIYGVDYLYTLTWHFFCFSKKGATLTYKMLDANGAVLDTITDTGWPNSGTDVTYWNIGAFGNGTGDFFNGRLYALKAWTRPLSVAEFMMERLSIKPVNKVNLLGYWPLLNHGDVRDYSGLNHHWLVSGTPTTEASRNLPWSVPDNKFWSVPWYYPEPLSISKLSDASTFSAQTSITSGVVSPSANSLLLVVVRAGKYDSGTAPGISSCTTTLSGVSFTEQVTKSVVGAGTVPWKSDNEISIFTAQCGTAPGTGTITGNFDTTCARNQISVYEIKGHNRISPVRQVKSGASLTSTPSLTLDSVPISTSLVFGAVTSALDSITPGTNFTELLDTGIGDSNPFWAQDQYDLNNATTTVNWTDCTTNMNNVFVAIEIATTYGECRSSKSAYLEGTSGGTATSSSKSAFTSGASTSSSSKTAYLSGVLPTASSSKSSYLKGQTDGSSSKAAFTKGQESSSSSKAAYAQGAQNTSAQIPAWIKGQDSTTSSKSAYLRGGQNVPLAYTENFDGSEGALTSPWVTHADFIAVRRDGSGKGYCNTGEADAFSIYSGVVADSQYSQCVFSTIDDNFSLILRAQGWGNGDTFYTCWTDPNTNHLAMAFYDGTFHIFISDYDVSPISSGSIVRFEARGNTLSFFVDGEKIVSVVENTYNLTGGYVGVGVYDTVARIDNWEGGSLDHIQPAYLRGADTANSSKSAYLSGQTAGGEASDSQSAYLAGSSSNLSSNSAYTQGQDSASSSKNAYLAGSNQAFSSQNAYLAGQDSIVSNRSAYLTGEGHETSTLPGYLQGRDTGVSSLPVFIRGQVSGLASIPAFTQGSTVSQSSTAAYLSGSAGLGVSSKSAYLEGTGQRLKPDGDVTVGSWKNELGGSTLYTSLDETEPNDADYVWYETAVQDAYFEVSLSNPPSDVASGTHVLRWRAYRKAGANTVTLRCEVRQGNTQIAYDERILTDDVQQFDTVVDGSSITNYTDLRIRITVVEIT